MPSTTSSSRRSFKPVAYGAVLALVLIACWRFLVQPFLPEPPVDMTLLREDTWTADDLWISGERDGAEIAVIGASRVGFAIERRAFERGGLGPTIVLWYNAAQLLDLLDVVERLDCRRLVMSLHPVSVYMAPEDRGDMDALDSQLPGRQTTSRRVDSALGVWLQETRNALVRPITTRHWRGGAWFVQKQRADKRLRDFKQWLKQSTGRERYANLTALMTRLEDMQARGWEIVCVRLPLHEDVLTVEESALPPEYFEQMCAKLGVPYLQYQRAPYETVDGSHLRVREALRFSGNLVRDIRRETGW